ncbi:anti-sigma factor family protein [Streptomyces sp. NPDC001544]|uniref:anti-sigma factor family protein n=1 Tax=Streptomyces sp. NPDC001544 TaxID=3364584 RepID=UPI0036BDF71D
MSSTTDTAGHPDIAEISDLTEGLLPASRTDDLRRHLQECELCAEVQSSLEEIRALLGTLPGPTHMPADVADRIDAALAAEARPIATDVDAHVSRETPAPADRPAGHSRAATGPGRQSRGRGRRRRFVVLGSILTAAVLGSLSFFLQSLGGSNTTAQSPRATSIGTFSGSDIRSQVDGLLSTNSTKSTKNSPQQGESTKTLIQPSAPVPECVRKGIQAHGDILGAKTGTYEGKTAFLVVLSDPSDRARVTAYVIDASCISRQSVSAGKVLVKQSLARP